MKRVVRAVFAAAMVAVGVMTAHADDDVRWVSPTGDDTKDGLTEATAWKTPQKAIDFFGTGAGTVRLTAGTFEGANPILNLASGAVKVIGAGRDLTVIKPDNTVAKSAVSVVKSGAVVSNLTVTGCSGAYAVSLQNGGGIVFCNIVSNKAGGVKFVAAATSSFCRNCSVSYNSNASGPSAVYHNSWGAAYLRNCLFIGNTTTKASCGTVTADNGGALKVSFCTFVGNVGTATGGIYENANDILVKNCIFKMNRASVGSLTYDYGSAKNRLTLKSCMSDQGGGTDPVTGDPAFAGPAAGDYRLRLGSACRNAGIATASTDGAVDATDVDYYGRPRVSGSAPDLGCAEIQEPTAAVCDIDISNAFVHYAENLTFSPRFEQVAAGEDYDCGWTLSTADGTVLTNLFGAEQTAAFDVFGPHVLKLFATNRANSAEVLTAAMPLDFGLPLTNYVSAVGGAGVWPYAHPETATTDFDAAVAAVCVGGVVKLLEGTFTGPQPLLVLTNEVTVLGSGAGKTILKPDNTASAPTVKLNFPLACLGGVTLTGNTKDRAVWIGNHGTLQDSVVVSNTAGGVYVPNNFQGNVRILRCTIADNAAARGAGIYACSWDPVRVESCLIVGNVATGAQSWDGGGGGLYVDNGSNKSHYYDYCTVIGNRAAYAGGGFMRSTGTHYMRNCIVKDNECGASQSTPNISGASSFVISNTWTAEGYGTNPVSGDVAFKDPSGGDYHLRSVSVCRDAGADLSGSDATKLDRDGKTRFWGDAPDAGCYEFVPGGETTCDITG